LAPRGGVERGDALVPLAAMAPWSYDEPLLPKVATACRVESPRVRASAFLRTVAAIASGARAPPPALVVVICVLSGTLHPLFTEASKTAHNIVCTTLDDGTASCNTELASSGIGGTGARPRMSMPFHAVTLTLVAEFISVVSTVPVATSGPGGRWAALRRLLAPASLLKLWPIGLVYGLGDFLQTTACNAASAPVVLVVGQSKLLLAALLSVLMLRREQPTNWVRLIVISSAAAAGADIGSGAMGSALVRQAELFGAFLAFVKAGLSSAGAVLSERFYKQDRESFWVVSFRVQLMMFSTSCLLLPWTMGGESWSSLSLSDAFFSGPGTLCSSDGGCEPLPFGSPGATCTCVDRRGWDWMTVLAALAIVGNGFSTGLTLKHLSAVTKSICNACSAGVFYIAYVVFGFRPFSMAQANVLLIVVVSSYEYATVGKTGGARRTEVSRATELRREVAEAESAAAALRAEIEKGRDREAALKAQAAQLERRLREAEASAGARPKVRQDDEGSAGPRTPSPVLGKRRLSRASADADKH